VPVMPATLNREYPALGAQPHFAEIATARGEDRQLGPRRFDEGRRDIVHHSPRAEHIREFRVQLEARAHGLLRGDPPEARPASTAMPRDAAGARAPSAPSRSRQHDAAQRRRRKEPQLVSHEPRDGEEDEGGGEEWSEVDANSDSFSRIAKAARARFPPMTVP